ncbi:MAG: tetratricopeptide repeat protein [Acidobacteria bacterium]|nr:tetratricopeptide repeat protein [Acidobacteriota bacterium]
MAKRRRQPVSKPAREAPFGPFGEAPVAEGKSGGRKLGLIPALAAGAALAVVAWSLWSWSSRSPSSGAPSRAQAPPPIAGRPGYVDPAACSGCHAEIAATYQQTGMGRAFVRATPEAMAHLGAEPAEYFHQPSQRYYRIERRAEGFFQKRWQEGPDGAPTNVVEKRIDYVMGSGNHARTYLHQYPDGRLIELPLGWYAEKGGFVAMNPGFDQPRHRGFRREISFDCLFCHNAYPRVEPGADAAGRDPLFPGSLPEGIDCQRCHGPGEAHLQAAGAGESEATVRAAIFNPARETPARRLEVCLQCHFESTSRRLPYALVRFDRGAFSYEPREPLGDFALHFDHPEGVRADKFEIAGHGYRFLQSQCFRESEGMTCTTCHDPHQARRGEAGRAAYNGVCRDCHQAAPAGSGHADYARADCVGCHMPPRRTEDVVEVVMTDHKIERRPPPAAKLLAPLPELVENEKTLYHGEVAVDYPPGLPQTTDDELLLAVAQVHEQTNLEAGTPRLRALIEKHQPSEGSYYFELAEAYWSLRRYEDALPWYQQALERQPGHVIAARNYAVALERVGRPEQAEQVLRQALEAFPGDPKALTNLGESLLAQERPAEARGALEQALERDPDSPEAWNNLARALRALGEPARAIEAAREAIRREPAFSTAHNNLANLLLAEGQAAEAERHFRLALEAEPGYAEAHYNYALMLIDGGRLGEAQRELREAIRFDPGLAPAHMNLGGLLAQGGDVAAAEKSFRKAVQLAPDFADAQFNLGVALASRNRLDEAAACFEKALALDASYHPARLNLAMVLAAQGEPERARAELQTVERTADEPLRQAARDALQRLGP